MQAFGRSSGNYAAIVIPEPPGHLLLALIVVAITAAIASIAAKFGIVIAALALLPVAALRWGHANHPASQASLPGELRLDASGAWRAQSERGAEHVQPIAGTFVFASLGLLVLRRTDGSKFWLIVRRVNQPCDQWRRFLVLWRLVAARVVTRDPSC